MENKSTVEIHEELASREGVTEIIVGPYETFQIVQDQRTHEFTGPARVLIHKEVEQVGKNPVQLMNELEKLSAPLIEFLNDNYNPHCRIEITQDSIRVVEDLIGIPIMKTFIPETALGKCYGEPTESNFNRK